MSLSATDDNEETGGADSRGAAGRRDRKFMALRVSHATRNPQLSDVASAFLVERSHDTDGSAAQAVHDFPFRRASARRSPLISFSTFRYRPIAGESRAMTSILEFYHQWRKRTFPASKADLAWRHAELSSRLDGIAANMPKIQGAAALVETLDRISDDLHALKKRSAGPRSGSLAEAALAIVNSMRHGKVKFLQIGGNDGRLADPAYPFIAAYDWRGVIVEPVPEYFEALCRTHAERPWIECVNVAIDARCASREIYKVKGDVVRAQVLQTGACWLQGCASFSKELLLGGGLAEEEIEAVTIPTTTGAELTRTHDLADCDVMIIDVEGAEEIVLSSFDFGQWRPRVIIFESELKTNAEIAPIEMLLGSYGYQISWENFDSVAVLKP
jgi:FkbM family methyltransferase